MKRLFLSYLVALSFLLGCQGSNIVKEPSVEVSGVLSFPVIEIHHETLAQEMADWANKRIQELCKQSNIPTVPFVRLLDKTPALVVNKDGNAFYIAGFFWDMQKMSTSAKSMASAILNVPIPNTERFCLDVWIRDNSNLLRSKAELKEVILHELLHYYDTMKNLSWPSDHNEIYRKRLIEMRWLS
jgi:Zn-dependent protease with chaperone function